MPKSQTGSSTDRYGFTLIELVVVIVVLSLIGLISLPLLVNRIDGNERAKLRRIAGTVKQLYNEATLTRDEHELVFDLERNSLQAYRLRTVSADRVEREPFRRELDLEPLNLQQIEVEGQGSFRSGQITVRVFPLGWMEQTRLLVRQTRGDEVQMIFSPLTGTTRIDEVQNRAL